MARRVLAVMAVLVLILGAALPGEARGGRGGGGGHAGRGGGGSWAGAHGGHGHRGGHSHWRGHGHWGGRHGGCCWWSGAFVGGVALGATLAYPYWSYPYRYAYPYPYYSYPYYYESVYPTQYLGMQGAQTAPPPVAVQRVVVYPHGKYVLHGDGLTRAWQWVWVPSIPSSTGALAQSQ